MRDVGSGYAALLWAAVTALSFAGACGGEAFSGEVNGSGAPGAVGGDGGAGPSNGGVRAAAGSDEPGGSPSSGAGGAASLDACDTVDDCGVSSGCQLVACVDGACLATPVAEDTACEGGACDATGECVASTCDSQERDGDETGTDCGGSCELCPDGQGCATGDDCLSGVCDQADECAASACTDGVQNGSETGIDCGGTCGLKCELKDGCSSVADCAVAAGDRPESVRCLANICTSTKPPSAGGVPLYWQDFLPARLVTGAALCGAPDEVCLLGAVVEYPMFGLAPSGALKPLTRDLLFTNDGVVGSAGRFDGATCVSRSNTNLSFADRGAFSAMAWVKSGRNVAPWESAVVGSPNHYIVALDANPDAERLLTAVATSQSSLFDYRTSPEAGQVPAGEWHHVAQVYDTTDVTLMQYVDGIPLQTTAISGNVTSGAASAFIGCRMDAALSQFFVGSLDELVLYARALSANELADYVRRTAPAP